MRFNSIHVRYYIKMVYVYMCMLLKVLYFDVHLLDFIFQRNKDEAYLYGSYHRFVVASESIDYICECV